MKSLTERRRKKERLNKKGESELKMDKRTNWRKKMVVEEEGIECTKES